MYFFKNPVYYGRWFRQNKVYRNDDQGGVHQKCKYLTFGSGVLVRRLSQICVIFLLKSSSLLLGKEVSTQ